jgi:hypothetical protein
MKRILSLLIVFSLFVACSSENKLGEACEETGKTDGECESGSVCGKDTSGTILCLKVCTVQTDCGGDNECNGVEGSSLKACRIKSATSDPGKK